MSSQAPQKSPKPNGNNHLLREPRSRVEAVKVSELSRNLPRAMVGKIMNSVAANMPALPVPNRDRVHAFTSQEALDRWGEETSGLRALEKGDNVITMFDVIGEDFWNGGGITAKSVARQLRAIAGPVEIGRAHV